MNRISIISLASLVAVIAAAIVGMSSPVASAASCPPPPTPSTPFSSLGDNASYVLANDGTFDLGSTLPTTTSAKAAPGTVPWTLSGGASIVNDNDPVNLGHGAGPGALSLPAGSSATSGCTTAPMITSVLRFYVKNTGSATGQLHVQILVNGGKNGVLDGGMISAGSSWAPTSQIMLPWAHPLNGAVQLQVVLTPVGQGASFEVDDVFIDPFCSK